MRTTSNSITHLYEPNPDQVKFINHMNRNGYGPNKTFPITLHFRTFKRDSGRESDWVRANVIMALFYSSGFSITEIPAFNLALILSCVCRWHSQIALLCIFRLKGFAPRFTSATRIVSVLASVCAGGTVQTVAKYLHHFAVLSLVYFSETALTRLIKIKLNMQPQLDFPISTRSLSRFIPISIRRTSLEQNRHKNEMLNLKDKQKRKFPSWATEKMALNILKTKFPRLIRLDSFSVRVNAFLTSLSYENQFRLYQLCLFAPFPVIWLRTSPFVSLTLSGEEEKINTVKDVLNDICGCLFIAIYSIELNELVCALDFAW